MDTKAKSAEQELVPSDAPHIVAAPELLDCEHSGIRDPDEERPASFLFRKSVLMVKSKNHCTRNSSSTSYQAANS